MHPPPRSPLLPMWHPLAYKAQPGAGLSSVPPSLSSAPGAQHSPSSVFLTPLLTLPPPRALPSLSVSLSADPGSLSSQLRGGTVPTHSPQACCSLRSAFQLSMSLCGARRSISPPIHPVFHLFHESSLILEGFRPSVPLLPVYTLQTCAKQCIHTGYSCRGSTPLPCGLHKNVPLHLCGVLPVLPWKRETDANVVISGCAFLSLAHELPQSRAVSASSGLSLKANTVLAPSRSAVSIEGEWEERGREMLSFTFCPLRFTTHRPIPGLVHCPANSSHPASSGAILSLIDVL